MSNFNEETVLSVHHWTDNLFSFKTTRNPSFRFRNGEFTMIGIPVNGKPLLRAYSVASANYEEELEFFSIKVDNGPLTSHLQHLKVGDAVMVSRKATGTLVIDNLFDGRNLYLLGTGTGLAPFLSVIKDPETYERFEKVVLVHGVRQVAELAYGDNDHQDAARGRADRRAAAREADLLPHRDARALPQHGPHHRPPRLGQDHRRPRPRRARCRARPRDDVRQPRMLNDTKALLLDRGFIEGNHGEPGQFVIEKAFVER